MLNIFRKEVALCFTSANCSSFLLYKLVGGTLAKEWLRNFSLTDVFSTTLFSTVGNYLGSKAHSILTKVVCTFWSNELKANLMHFTPVKHNCSCFYAPYAYFGGLQHCQSPEKEHPLTAELLQQLHLELCLTHLCSRLEELPVGRESARFFLHTTFHLGPTTETTYRDAS